MQPLRTLSLWMDQLDEPLCARPALRNDLDVDVCIIGAGYTGLWTAYYLKRQAPQLNIAVIEAQIAGFGASGRNGGWLMGNLLGEDRLLGTLSPQQRRASIDLLHGIPDEVHRVLQNEGIDCDYRKGGVLYCAARYPEQERSLRAYLDDLYRQGMTEDDYRWLSPEQLGSQLRVSNAFGAIYSPHTATIQPAKLVRGLARAVEALGVPIYENTPAIDWQPSEVRTPLAQIRCQWMVPAVEGYAASLPPLGKHQLPVQSLLVATEPLPEATWEQIGLSQGQAFSESSRQVTYGQRTADNRLVFGARGGYRFGGRLRENFNLDEHEVELRRYLFGELFPQLKQVRITHTWGGNLGMARRFRPHMLCDRQRGIALAGGYGGEGVGATNLGGRTLAALILNQRNELTAQPWVLDNRPLSSLASWPPEPCRWLGYNAIIQSFVHEDRTLANPASAPWRRRLAISLADFMEGFNALTSLITRTGSTVMSITQFKNTEFAVLDSSNPVAVPLGEPVAVASVTCVERSDGVETGIWECTPGRWRRQIVQQEFCHFIKGRCTFTPDGGEPLVIEAGDALMLPANSTGTWDIQETVRKTYVLVF